MEKQRPITYADVRRQVARMQKLYSAIGEPLAVDVIFELCHHLPTVLQGGEGAEKGQEKASLRFVLLGGTKSITKKKKNATFRYESH